MTLIFTQTVFRVAYCMVQYGDASQFTYTFLLLDGSFSPLQVWSITFSLSSFFCAFSHFSSCHFFPLLFSFFLLLLMLPVFFFVLSFSFFAGFSSSLGHRPANTDPTKNRNFHSKYLAIFFYSIRDSRLEWSRRDVGGVTIMLLRERALASFVILSRIDGSV